MAQKFALFLLESNDSIGTERLHQTLNPAVEIDSFKFGEIPAAVVALKIITSIDEPVPGSQASRTDRSKREARSYCGKPGRMSLEIDQVGLLVPNNDVLRLKIAVHQDSRIRS